MVAAFFSWRTARPPPPLPRPLPDRCATAAARPVCAAAAADTPARTGYYRRGSAYFALSNYKLALKDFKQAAKMEPKDRNARSKLAACDKARKDQLFAMAIESEDSAPISDTLNPDDITVDDSYDGPRLGDDGVASIDLEFVQGMMEYYKSQKNVHIK